MKLHQLCMAQSQCTCFPFLVKREKKKKKGVKNANVFKNVL